MPLSIDPENTWAILIGVGEFKNEEKNLTAIPAVKNNLADLRKLLEKDEQAISRPLIGIPKNHIIVVENSKNFGNELTAGLEKLSGKKIDTLIVYYVGHGFYHSKGLHLATFETRITNLSNLPLSTLAFANLWESTFQKAANIFYILDCCDSGLVISNPEFAKNAWSPMAPQTGKVISALTATQPIQIGKAPPEDKYTVFTGKLIELLENGCPESGPTLTWQKIYEELKSRLKGYPEPWCFPILEPFHFAYNRAYSQPESLSTMSSNSVTAFDSSLTPLHLIMALNSGGRASKKYDFQAWLFFKEKQEFIQIHVKEGITLKQFPKQINQAYEEVTKNKEVTQLFGSTLTCFQLTLEFFLPVDLLISENVEEKYSLPMSKEPIGFDYCVLVRPSERLKNKVYIKRLKERWSNGDILKEPFENCVERLTEPYQKEWDELGKKSVFSLNFKPDTTFLGKLLMTLGAPVVTWINNDEAKDRHAQLDKRWSSCCLAEIPQSLRSERYSIFLKNDNHTGHISLLWDDPNRIPPIKLEEPTNQIILTEDINS